MLAALLRLEAEPWPGGLRAYSAMLVALSSRCEQHRAAKGEIYDWLERVAGGALVVRNEVRRECLRDAFHEAVASIDGLLLHFRAGLRDDRRPNLRSMLVAWIVWRAGDLRRSLHQRHDDRRSRGVDATLHLAVTPVADNPETTVITADIAAMLAADGSPAARALLLVGAGYSVAEAARRTGASRQQVYRARGLLRETVDG